jgi:hypothetical protein
LRSFTFSSFGSFRVTFALLTGKTTSFLAILFPSVVAFRFI